MHVIVFGVELVIYAVIAYTVSLPLGLLISYLIYREIGPPHHGGGYRHWPNLISAFIGARWLLPWWSHSADNISGLELMAILLLPIVATVLLCGYDISRAKARRKSLEEEDDLSVPVP